MKSSRLDTLLQFLDNDPDDSFTRYAVALEYISMGNTEQGIGYLKDLIDRDPGYVASYQQLGSMYAENDRKEDARAVLIRGIEIARQSGELHAAQEMQDVLDELEN
jgi:tetratricopeptide (TPR) repeat protein